MILKELKLENIRSYTNETIKFPEGSVLLSGDIGSGKSTILLAIEFALFGLMRGELSGEALLRNGKNKGSVELKFNIDNNEYIIYRALKRANSILQDSGYIIINGRKQELSPVELKSKILEILNYPDSLISKSKSLIFRYTVYTPQEEMKRILFENREERLDTLRKLFGIDKYKTIKDNVVICIREIKRKKTELEIKSENLCDLEKELNSLIEKLEIVEKNIFQKEKEKEDISHKLNEEKKRLSQLEKGIEEFREKKKDYEIKVSEIAQYRTQIENIRKKLSIKENEIKDIETRLKNYEGIDFINEAELEEELNFLTEKYSSLVKEKSSLNERIKFCKEKIERLKKEIMNLSEISKEEILLKSKIEELKKDIEIKPKYEETLENLSHAGKKINSEIEKISVIEEEKRLLLENLHREICPTCMQKIDENHRKKIEEEEKNILDELKKKKIQLKEKLEKIENNIEKLKTNIKNISKKEIEYGRLNEKIAALETSAKEITHKQKELSVLVKELNENELKIKDIKDQELIDLIMQKKKNLSKIRENNIKFREMKNLLLLLEKEESERKSWIIEKERIEKQLTELINQKDALEFYIKNSSILDDYEKQKEQVEVINNKIKITEFSLVGLNQEKKILENKKEELEKKRLELNKIKAKISQISQIENWLDVLFINLIDTIEKHIMVSIHREFEGFLKEWLSLLIEGIEISLEDDFSVKIMQDGYELDVQNLSGGEKTSVALAYRLALNKVINDLIPIRTKDIIILDEPTDGFSSEQLDKVRDILEQLNMKQTIIVSHEPKMESFVENIIKIVKTDTSKAIY